MLDLNKIYCMDALEFLKQIPDKSVDLVLTDPPYGIGINKMNFVTSGAIKVGGAYRNDYSNHKTDWDNESLKPEIFREISRVGKKIAIFGANNFPQLLSSSRGWIVWDKRCEDKYCNDFADGELIWTNQDINLRIIRFLWSGMLQEEMGLHKEKRLHPTQKPIFVIKKIIELLDKDGKGIILDCFMGSGTTAVACKQLGRNFIGCDNCQEYVDMANKRLAQEVLI
jgi:site-specific DNA-methyltransferase (adenine-specific)